MKYALFVLGMILIVVGGYFLFSGSNIIEVERGWSSVIAGTTALTGGVITLGLAGVVKSLEDLQRLWAAGVERPAAGPVLLETPAPSVTPIETPVAPDFGPVLFDADAPSLFEEEVARDELPEPPPPDVIPSPLPKERPRLTPQFERSQDTTEPSAAIAALRQRVADDFSLNWPSFNQRPEPPREPAIPAEPTPAEPVSTEPEPAPVTPPPLHLDDLDIDEPELLRREAEAELEVETQEPEAEPVPAAPAEFAAAEGNGASAPEAPKPKAIGRYEADGTIYVMFADGSIEAQSAEGTRHFNSMAELKASFHA
ncbi:MAG: sodium/calcium exchanger protein [Methylovirgula sp.]|uniref:sodium/calcium exchanger protein n=1 Tax=Methylovirgula sp. TaxID=1978224 RepID=UPI003076536B